MLVLLTLLLQASLGHSTGQDSPTAWLPPARSLPGRGVPVPGLRSQLEHAVSFQAGGPHAGVQVADRLAAVYLHHHSTPERDQMLICAVGMLRANLGLNTPLDIYIFVEQGWHPPPGFLADVRPYVMPAHAGAATAQTPDLNSSAGGASTQTAGAGSGGWGNVAVLRVPPEQWSLMAVMGQWRLAVQFRLMAAAGYGYVLQTDDDLFVLRPVKVNLVAEMRARNQSLATHQLQQENWRYARGLPELARYYITSKNFTPSAILWDHVTPRSLEGLYSAHRPGPDWEWDNPPGYPDRGYDLTHPFGNFLILSTHLWSQPLVQDWVTTAIMSGGLARHRWQEQGVLAWVWLLFVQPAEFWLITSDTMTWEHTKVPFKESWWCGPRLPSFETTMGAPATTPRTL